MGSYRRSRLRAALLGTALIAMTAAPVRAASPATFTVTTAADLAGGTCGATCSLRQAINAANANAPASDTIAFAVPGGPATITPTTALPAITDTVLIDGTSQPGARIVGTGAGPTANGLHVLASGTVIRGLSITNFARDGILLDGVHDTVIGGYDGQANTFSGNGGDGITVIGDATAVRNELIANSISGNGELAIDLADDNRLGLVGSPVGGGPFGPNNVANGPFIEPPTAPVTAVTLHAAFGPGTSAPMDVFWSPTCPLDPHGSGYHVPQAAEFLGTAAGDGAFALPSPRTFGYITATGHPPFGTSEVSQCAFIATATDLAASASVTPAGPIDVGSPVGIDLTVSNLGPATHTDPISGFSVTSGTATFVSVTSSQGSCAIIDASAVCGLGTLGSGASANVTISLIPTSGGELVLEGGVGDVVELDPDPGNNFLTLTIDAVAEEDESATIGGSGGTVTSDSESDGATPTDPIETLITLPPGTGGLVTIAERPDATPPPIGYSFFGEAALITAPTLTAAHPLVFQFTLDSTIVPTAPLVVFRNGVPLAACTVANPLTDPSATPDPCYLLPQTVGDDLVITVRTSAASTWRVGTRLPFTFVGFFAPVDNGGILNQVKAGQAIPVKFSLGGNRGLSIFQSGSPSSAGIACGNARVDPVEQTVTAGSSSLAYDAAMDRYQYVWKSDKAWSGTCRRLTLSFADGSTQTALFQFVK